MKNIIFILLFIPFTAEAGAKLRYSREFVLEKVLELKRQKFRPEIPVPLVLMESETPLKIFQDAIEAQWGMRPDFITNAFSVSHNMIFLSDDEAYYERTKRCIDDSLAHELTHYVQAKYQGFDLHDDSLEWDAIDVQTAFRETYCR